MEEDADVWTPRVRGQIEKGKGQARGWAVGSRFRPGGGLGCRLGSWAERGRGAELACCWAELLLLRWAGVFPFFLFSFLKSFQIENEFL